MATMAAAAATTKMKAQTASMGPSSGSEFLSGGGADLGPPQRKGPIVSAGTDQDDLDLFLSEITVQFDDDEVQTLYVGPVEIVEDDLKNGKAVPKGTSGVGTTGPAKQPPPPLPKTNDDVTKASDANLAAATTRKTKQSAEKPAAGGAEVDGGGSGGGRDGAAKEVDSANDGRPHRLTVATTTEPAVVIDPKDGENSQTVATEDLTPPVTRHKVISTPEKSSETTKTQSVKPTAIISPCTKRKSPSPAPPAAEGVAPAPQRSHQSQRINKRLKLTTERNPARPTPIKEEIKQLSPKLAPAVPEKQEATEPEPQVETSAGVAEEEECPPEGELIVPDVLEFDKDSSPAGSDSGIENEGAEQQLNKAKEVPEESQAEPCEVVKETVEHIPENENTQREEEEKEEKKVEPSQGRVIKCAKCVQSFKHVLWYKKHLMNYHGIDLSNIAHFLSNLQTLDEGIQDGEGQDDVEDEYADFQLEKSGTEGGQEASETDKTDGGGNGNSEQQRVDELEANAVARLRQQQEASSTPSPNTLQMYPEVKLSTKSKQIRRRKDKLIPINSDADMKIKHEYVTPSTMGQSDESASSSQSTQPLINNMFVVKYLEQAALMVGAPNTNVLLGLPDTANKENSKSGQLVDPLATEGSEGTDGLTPYERAKIVGVNTDDGPQFTCTVCETVFDERHAAQDHVNFVHKDVKRRSCPHCGRTFTQTGDLTRHVRIHTGIRPFKCPFEGCQFSFISSGDLHKHVRRHQQLVPKPHICGTCGKDFERGYDLKRHSSMHAKDDPNHEFFSCELCSKTFARKDQYRAHTYRHIGYKPHKCKSCNKSFSDASNYSKHLKVHEMDGLFLICHHCSKPFKNKMGISKHVLHCKYKHQTGGDKPVAARKKIVKKEEVGEPSSSHF